jgi:hypothetical protein
MQVPGDGRKPRQIHINTKRAKRRKQTQDQYQENVAFGGHV